MNLAVVVLRFSFTIALPLRTYSCMENIRLSKGVLRISQTERDIVDSSAIGIPFLLPLRSSVQTAVHGQGRSLIPLKNDNVLWVTLPLRPCCQRTVRIMTTREVELASLLVSESFLAVGKAGSF